MQINLSERTARSNYFPTAEDFLTESAIDLLHAITYSLLLKRKVVATRFGSEEKKGNFNDPMDQEKLMDEIRGYCHFPLENYLASLTVPLLPFEPNDVLRIYDKMFLI